jgi:transketolase C-terminal domain/subunit
MALESSGISVDVVDMPSIDENAIVNLYQSGKPVFVAEQNNGYIWTNLRKVLFDREKTINLQKLIPVNTTDHGELHYIHSGTYTELSAYYGLDAAKLSERIVKMLTLKELKNKPV